MKVINLFVLLFLMTSCAAKKIPLSEIHTLVPVELYENTDDFLNKKVMQADLGILIKDQSDQHITTKGIYDLKTGEKSKKGASAWVMKYNNENYFNLGYSTDTNHWGTFAKMDIEGRYCAIIVSDDSPHVLKSTSSHYGGGIAGALIADSRKWGKGWQDKNGAKKRLLLIDTEITFDKTVGRNKGSLGNYLTRRNLKKIIQESGLNVTDERVKDIEFEKILEIIETANQH